MHYFTTILSSNGAVVALANLGGLIGLLIVLYTALTRTVAFVREAWHTSVKTAVRSIRFRKSRRIVLSSKDLHYFLAVWARQWIKVILFLFLTIMIVGQTSIQLLVKLAADEPFRSSLSVSWKTTLLTLPLPMLASAGIVFALEASNFAIRVANFRRRRISPGKKRRRPPGGAKAATI